MSITKTTTYTLRCDDGRYCLDAHGNQAWATLQAMRGGKRQIIKVARLQGWRIRGNATQCPKCVQHRRSRATLFL